jgi:hypothetical protein
MKGNRIRVGFHRVGIALALLPALAAIGVLATGAYLWGQPLVKPPIWEIEHKETRKLFEFAHGTEPKMIGKKMRELFSPMPVPDGVLSEVDKVVSSVDRRRQSGVELVKVGAALAALAVGVYAASWLVGWIIRGFIGESAT